MVDAAVDPEPWLPPGFLWWALGRVLAMALLLGAGWLVYDCASSDRFLRFAVERVRARGGRVVHLDLTIVCEAPKIGPHRDAMRARIAEIAGISIDRVGVKATTSEKLGFTGRREGIAAFATATVRLPWSAP